VSQSGGLFGFARRALGASSDRDRNEYVLAGAYLPLSALSDAWRRRARFTLALAHRLGGPDPCCAAPTGTVRVHLDSNGALQIEALGALAHLVTPTKLTQSDAEMVARAVLAGRSSSANDGLAVKDSRGQWWVLIPAPGVSDHLLNALAGHGWNVVGSKLTYRLRLFDRLDVTLLGTDLPNAS
jgi:hypothetical protein